MMYPTPERIDEVKKLRFLFIRVPRTASTSMDRMLGGYNRHIFAKAYRPLYTPREWKTLFKFGFVRNPYTRFVSIYNAFAKEQREINKYLQEEGLERLIQVRGEHFTPQADFVTEGGKIIVDFLGRFEQLRRDWNKVTKKIGLPNSLPHLAQSEQVPLTAKNKKLVYNLFKEDFELFGYHA